jgi:hypothetical protein
VDQVVRLTTYGYAIYPQIAVSKSVTFGLREEYFKAKATNSGAYIGISPGNSVLLQL